MVLGLGVFVVLCAGTVPRTAIAEDDGDRDTTPGFVTPPELGDRRPEGAADFDFLLGSWLVENRALVAPLTGSTRWREWPATLDVTSVLGGLGVVDRYRAELRGTYYEGMTIRLFDRSDGGWTVQWVDTRDLTVGYPIHGSFAEGVGTFYGEENVNGRTVRVRSRWEQLPPDRAHWEQAYSDDGGASWEVNWVMVFTRVGGARDGLPADSGTSG